MRVLILHMRFHPDLTGTGPLITDLATDLAAMGVEVTVVTSMPHYGRRDIPARYRGRLLVRERFRQAEVWRTMVYVPPSPKGFYRGINYLSYSIMSVIAGVLSGRHDVILCISPPITIGLCGWLMGLVGRTPMVFNAQDIWPDCIVIVDQLRNPLLIRVFKCLERFIYQVSARITVLSEGMKQDLQAKGVRENKIRVIPNWTDVQSIHPVSRDNLFRTTHRLSDHFVVMFAGNLGFNAVLDTVLDAARLLEHDRRILFLIVGEGNAKKALFERARAMGLSNVRFLPTQSREVLSEMLGAADLSLVTLHRHLGRLNVPSKIYAIMASGRPVLAAVPEDSEIARLVQDSNCGIRIPPEDPQALAKAIEHLADQPEPLKRYGANGRKYVVEHLDRSDLINEYHDLLQEVIRARN